MERSVIKFYSSRLVESHWMVVAAAVIVLWDFFVFSLIVGEVKKKVLGCKSHIQREWKIKVLNIENWERVQLASKIKKHGETPFNR